jgi:hypothetical protein
MPVVVKYDLKFSGEVVAVLLYHISELQSLCHMETCQVPTHSVHVRARNCNNKNTDTYGCIICIKLVSDVYFS